MKNNAVDTVAMTLPFAGSLIPAIMTFESTTRYLGFAPLEGGVIGVVVAGLGFTAITTALDVLEDLGPKSKQFVAALCGTLVYLIAVLVVNAILGDADLVKKVALSLLALLAEVGGLMVGIRNQLGKFRAAKALADAQKLADEQNAKALKDAAAQDERDYQRKLNGEALENQRKIQAEELAHQRQMQADAQREANELKRLRLQQALAKSQQVAETRSQVVESVHPYAETFGKWHRWPDVPQEYKLQVTAFVLKAQQDNAETFKKVSASYLMERYDLKERMAYMWVGYVLNGGKSE